MKVSTTQLVVIVVAATVLYTANEATMAHATSGADVAFAIATPGSHRSRSRISARPFQTSSVPTTRGVGRRPIVRTMTDDRQPRGFPMRGERRLDRIAHRRTTASTSLRMGYSLPPSGGGGPEGPLEQAKAVLPAIGTALAVGLFFASPLGSLFFAVTNSLFVLAIVTPVLGFVGFKVWTTLNTIEAPCPSCKTVPVRVLKNGETGVCFNCGAYTRANEAGDGVELCNNPFESVLNENGGGTLFDSLFGGGGNQASDFKVVDESGSTVGGSGDGGSKKVTPEERAKKAKSQGKIIDVDVERD